MTRPPVKITITHRARAECLRLVSTAARTCCHRELIGSSVTRFELNGRVSTKERDEALACLVLQTVLGVRVERVDQSPLQGHHDLEICYTDGRIDAAEVVSARDPQWMRLSQAIAHRSYMGHADLTRLWFVLVKPTASLKELRVPALLRELESQGINQISDLGYGSVHLRLRNLGIESCFSTAPTEDHPVGFFMMPNVLTAWIGNGNDVVQFCNAFVADDLGSRKVAKLRRAEMVTERHLVNILTPDQLGPHTAVHTGEIPTQPPDLPHGVEWLWIIAGEWSAATRAIYWSPAGQWSEALVS